MLKFNHFVWGFKNFMKELRKRAKAVVQKLIEKGRKVSTQVVRQNALTIVAELKEKS